MALVSLLPHFQRLAEEASLSTKDVERVAEVVERSGIAEREARLKPVGVVKG